MPLDALGACVETTGAPYTLALSKQREGLTGLQGRPAYRFTGWLEAKSTGRPALIVALLTPRIAGKGPMGNYIQQHPMYTCHILLQME